ncbi:MAG: dephospho-CoA kinase [Pseudomonadota bacterium]
MKLSKPIIGLTGGIGSGKSTAANLFGELGAAVIDTDVIAHELTQPHGAAMAEISTAFGKVYVDSRGGLDRAAMRELVFSDAHAKHRLEAIIHPLIWTVARERVAQAGGLYIILVVPLLIESGSYHDRVERILVIDCDEQTQLVRTMARGGITEDIAHAIMRSQVTRSERLAAADDVIDNGGDISLLVPQIQKFHRYYQELASKSATKSQE